MKKLFLLLAFTGIVAVSSASTLSSFTKAEITNIGGDDKKCGDDKKKKCKKDKSCCKAKEATATGKSCSGEKAEGKKSCCKAKAEAANTTEAEKK